MRASQHLTSHRRHAGDYHEHHSRADSHAEHRGQAEALGLVRAGGDC